MEFQQSVWRAVYLTLEDHQALYRHHLKIFEAIRDKNPEEARRAMLEHLSFAEKRSEAYITQLH
jgi:GntR family transcriptional repressor for pyruvate dehydrogenase complex